MPRAIVIIAAIIFAISMSILKPIGAYKIYVVTTKVMNKAGISAYHIGRLVLIR